MNHRLYSLIETSLLASFISVTGFIKIPTFIMGSEFQMSAPIAVAICAVFGFKRYIIAGILSSITLFLMGAHTLIHVEIAMIFRIVVGISMALFGRHTGVILIAGPLGTLVARIILAFTLQVPAIVLIIPAIPGMLLTAFMSVPLTKLLRKTDQQIGGKQYGKAL